MATRDELDNLRREIIKKGGSGKDAELDKKYDMGRVEHYQKSGEWLGGGESYDSVRNRLGLGGVKAHTPAPAPQAPAPQAPPVEEVTTTSAPRQTSGGSGSGGSRLPSSNYRGPTKINQVNQQAIRDRAQRDAQLQMEALRRQAETGYGRSKTEVESQLEALRLAYGNEYRRIERDTQMSARNALQTQALRGFVTDGMAMGADMSARLAGAEQQAQARSQEMSQAQALQKILTQQGIEYNDLMNSLTGQEQNLIGKLIDDYTLRDRENNLREYQLTSDTALNLLGLDTDWNKFQDSLAWDKDKFGQEMSQRQYEFGAQYGLQNRQFDEQVASRLAQDQIERDRMAQQDRQWTGDDRWRRDQLDSQLGYQREQDAEDRRRYDQEFTYRQGRDQITDDRYRDETTYQRGQDALDRQQFSEELGLRREQANAGNKDLDWARGQITYKYMDQVDDMLNRLRTSQSMGQVDPELYAAGITSPEDIIGYFRDRGAKITAEGADLTSIINYLRQRTGLNVSPSTPGVGPVRQPNTQQMLDPFGIFSKNRRMGIHGTD